SGHTGRVWSVGWSPDGSRLVSGGDDAVVRVWDAVSGVVVHELSGHTGRVLSVGWSPDGSRLVSGGGDAVVRVWDAASGRPTGFTLAHLPAGELAVFDAESAELVGASAGAWRWLGWNITRDGRIDRLPAESFGPLPPLPRVPSPS
ncbi:MAG: hypothetical protein H0V92_08405, partial [Pseudonocardiales bacterium]|nr:hypothetical protein [Pseudonocardiales bacterium]